MNEWVVVLVMMFTFLAAVSIALVLVVALMRRSVAEKGAHVGAE